MSMKSQLIVLYFRHLKNGMPVPSGFHGFSRQIHSHWITLLLWLPCCFSLIAFKTFILYYCNLTLMHLGIDFFGFILFWIFWASWLCMFISIFQVEGFSAIISSKNFQQHTIFSLWDSINTKGSVHFFFHFTYLCSSFWINLFICQLVS